MNKKREKYRWLVISVISFILIIVLWLIDYSYVKYHILGITPVNDKGVTQKQFEQAGDVIKVEMDEDSLNKLKSLTNYDERTIRIITDGNAKEWQQISWHVTTARSKISNKIWMIEVSYRFNLSEDGKIIEYEKDSSSGNVTYFD
jgi:hypothetical protein